MYKKLWSALLLFFAFFCLSNRANACSCFNEGSPCGAMAGTPVVFEGLVKSIDEEKVNISRFGNPETVRIGLVAHFVIEEVFKGTKIGEVDVVTGGGGGDCGYSFEAGKRYLVYAYPNKAGALSESGSRTIIGGDSRRKPRAGDLNTTICTRTRELSYAQDDVELLRSFLSGKIQTRIFGFVTHNQRELTTWGYDIKEVGPMVGLRVTAEGPNGKYEARTDKEGHYRLTDLRPGKYKVKLELPDHYGPLFSFNGPEFDAEVRDRDCGTEHFFEAQIDGRISGHVYDVNGKPVQKQVQVSVITPESTTKPMGLANGRSAFAKNGYYEFDGLAPGKYILGIGLVDPPEEHCPYQPRYYGDSNELNSKAVITLKEGEQLKDYDFHMPAALETITITGIVYNSAGKPASGADINIYDSAKPAYGIGFGAEVTTDTQGRFSVRAFKGRQYLLHASIDKDYFAGTGVQSDSVPVDMSVDHPTVKLILNKPGIFPGKTGK